MGLLYSNDFTSVASWGKTSCDFVTDATYVNRGTLSGKLTASGGSARVYDLDIIGSIDVSDGGWIRVIYYLPETVATGVLAIWLHSADSDANRARCFILDSALTTFYTAGWHCADIKVIGNSSYHTAYHDAAYDATDVSGLSIQWFGGNGKIVYIDSIQIFEPDAADLPTFIFSFDDASEGEGAEHYSEYAPYLESLGWRGTFAINGDTIGDSGIMTLEQLLDLDARGHLIANHTWDHTSWELLTDEERRQQIVRNRSWLQDNGLIRGADLLCLPYKFYGDQTTMDMIFSHCRAICDSFRNCADPTGDGEVYQPVFHPADYVGRRILPRCTLNDDDFTTANIDAALAWRGTVGILTHATNGDADHLTLVQWKASCDYLAAKESAGLCRVVSWEDWIAGSGEEVCRAKASLSTTATLLGQEGAMQVLTATEAFGAAVDASQAASDAAAIKAKTDLLVIDASGRVRAASEQYQADSLFVDLDNGDDANDGCSWATAKKTLSGDNLAIAQKLYVKGYYGTPYTTAGMTFNDGQLLVGDPYFEISITGDNTLTWPFGVSITNCLILGDSDASPLVTTGASEINRIERCIIDQRGTAPAIRFTAGDGVLELVHCTIVGDIEVVGNGRVVVSGGYHRGSVIGNVTNVATDTDAINTLTKAGGDGDAAAIKTAAASADSKGTAMLARLGAWTGTGLNTILGALKALFGKSASLPSDIGGTYSAATDSQEALGEKTTAYPVNVNPNVAFQAGVNQQDVAVQCFKNGTAPMMARVYDHAGALLTQASVSSIAYSIYLLDEKDKDSRTVVTGHSAVALNDTDVIFDTLQTDVAWTADTTGYNFKHVVPIATTQAFTVAGRKYLVEYTITPTSGQKVIVRFRVNCI